MQTSSRSATKVSTMSVDEESLQSLSQQCACTQTSATNCCNRARQQRNLRIDVILLDGNQRQVLLDYRANGQDCLDKVCHSLGVFQEVDYFGLAYYGAKREELWVNMRNRLYKQLPTTAFGGVCRLYLRVKFYVPPHMMLHEETRHQVYLDVRNRLLDRHHWLLDSDLQDSQRHQSSFDDAQLNSNSPPLAAQLAALIVQADFGSIKDSFSSRRNRCHQVLGRLLDYTGKDFCCPSETRPSIGSSKETSFLELCTATVDCHGELSDLSPAAAEYHLLKTASTGLSMYGSHYHEVKDHLDARLSVAVGPDAVWLCRTDTDGKVSLDRYPYPRVQQVTISDRFLYLSISQENGNVRELGFRLATPKAANSLYRCVTETHSFFRCDTVRNNVATKTCRDVKGAFVSLFVERDLWSARNFVFDVRRTAKEVHDSARRQMHNFLSAAGNIDLSLQKHDRKQNQLEIMKSERVESATDDCHQETRASLLDRIRQLEQSRLCQICSDASISIVFLPCSHMLACANCADRLDNCPVCRADISSRVVCFVPWQED